MRMGIGLGVGINRSNYAQGIFNAYSARVVADGGVVEGGACVDAVSSLLQSASLLLIPSGYKGGKLYSEIPTNGNGDLTWTRGSDAFRTNASGLLQRVPWNLLQQSETFENAGWTKIASSVTANNTTAPNGTATADKLVEDTANSSHQLFQSVTLITSTNYTYSVYLKASERFRCRIRFATFATANDASVDLNTETCTAGTLSNVGDGWFRFSYSLNSSTGASSPLVSIALQDASGNTTYTGNGTSGIFIWGAQLVEGTTAQTYLPTTDRLNFPRLDYTYGSCPSALLEPQRTNLVLNSNDMTLWTNNPSTMTKNVATSPDGSTNALSYNNASVCSTIVTAANGVYSFSLYVKQGTSASASIDMSDSSTGDVVTTFTFSSKSFSGTSAGGSWTSAVTSYVELTNGWFRITLTATKNAGPGIVHKIMPSGTGTTLVYGAQLEAGAYPTTYIPTTSATATRVADSASKTGISSLIGQTEGVIYCDVYLDVRQSYTYFAIAPNITSTVAYVGIGFTATTITYEVVNSGIQASIIYLNSSTGRFKIAAAYKQNDFVLYINGTLIGTDTSGTVPTCSEIGLFAYSQNQPMRYNQVALFNTRLTNAQLATLTTL